MHRTFEVEDKLKGGSVSSRQTHRQGDKRTDGKTDKKHTDRPTDKQIAKRSKFFFSYQLRSKLSDIRKNEGTFPANKSSETKKKRKKLQITNLTSVSFAINLCLSQSFI